jgi:hypothetical protein
MLAFLVLVLVFAVATVAFLITQKHKLLILLTGLPFGFFGFALEHFNIGKTWSWANSGGTFMSVPYIVIITYFCVGIAAAAFGVSQEARKLINSNKNIILAVLVAFGVAYLVLKKDYGFFALALGLLFYSRFQQEIYFLLVAAAGAALDIASESFLMFANYLNYPNGYNPEIYFGVFALVFATMAAAHYFSQKLKK